jgi:hypothetical protein
MELSYETMELPADPGLAIGVCTAEPGSRSDQALRLLGSWTAPPTEQPAPSDEQAHRP